MRTIAVIILSAAVSGCWMPPVAIAVQGQYGTYGYSQKRGLEITVNATK